MIKANERIVALECLAAGAMNAHGIALCLAPPLTEALVMRAQEVLDAMETAGEVFQQPPILPEARVYKAISFGKPVDAARTSS